MNTIHTKLIQNFKIKNHTIIIVNYHCKIKNHTIQLNQNFYISHLKK